MRARAPTTDERRRPTGAPRRRRAAIPPRHLDRAEEGQLLDDQFLYLLGGGALLAFAKPFLAYTQRTWALTADNRPLHSEMGYWGPKPEGRIELVLAPPSGYVEIEEGTVVGTTLSLASRPVGATSTAKAVAAIN